MIICVNTSYIDSPIPVTRLNLNITNTVSVLYHLASKWTLPKSPEKK